jgi:hypothetical protein
LGKTPKGKDLALTQKRLVEKQSVTMDDAALREWRVAFFSYLAREGIFKKRLIQKE